MKPELYARALLKLLNEGEASKDAVAKIRAVLAARGRTALLPSIARTFARLAEREARRERSVLYVANASAEKQARKEAGAPHAKIAVDEDLVGGWRLEDKETLADASFKKHLLSIYNRVTR